VNYRAERFEATDGVRPPGELRLEGLVKAYGHVVALRGVSLLFRPGLTGIVGDNGAGKSTLLKILSGVETPDAGTIQLNGRPIALSTPAAARRAGIESLYQDLALADTLDVGGNIFLGRELTKSVLGLRVLKRRLMVTQARETISRLNIDIPDVRVAVRTLSGGQRQAVALARAVHFNAPVILMDEPTAALGPRETAAVVEIVRQLVGAGKLVIMVTHDIPRIVQLAHRIVVMRAGRVAFEVAASQTSPDELLAFMVGSKVAAGGGA